MANSAVPSSACNSCNARGSNYKPAAGAALRTDRMSSAAAHALHRAKTRRTSGRDACACRRRSSHGGTNSELGPHRRETGNSSRARPSRKWGELTDDDLDVVDGMKDQLVGKLQERKGIARDKAEKRSERVGELALSSTPTQASEHRRLNERGRCGGDDLLFRSGLLSRTSPGDQSIASSTASPASSIASSTSSAAFFDRPVVVVAASASESDSAEHQSEAKRSDYSLPCHHIDLLLSELLTQGHVPQQSHFQVRAPARLRQLAPLQPPLGARDELRDDLGRGLHRGHVRDRLARVERHRLDLTRSSSTTGG